MRISHSFVSRLALVAGATLFSTSVTAVSQERLFLCWPDLGTALSILEKDFGEHSFSTGVNEHKSFTVFTVDPGDRSWSMLLTMPNGHVCMVHFGEEWEPVIPDQGEPS